MKRKLPIREMSMTLIDKILRFADEHEMLPDAGLLLVCVSGGADSMCLLEALLESLRTKKFVVGAAHFNHRLRGSESDRDEAFVREHCIARGVPFFPGGGDVRMYASRNGLGLEEAARDMRYGFFFETAEKTGAERIATAHTMDDNTETMLLNLVRGTGTNGLSGIPPVRDNIIRPMLHVSRDEVMRFVAERAIPYVEDSTNSQEIHTRNRIRHSVVPVLKDINPRLNDAAAVAAELMRDDEDLISDIADLFISECCVGLTADAADLAVLPVSVSRRVIRKLYGGSLSFKHVKSVLALCAQENPSASLSLPGMTVYREYERVVFSPEQVAAAEGFAPVFPADGNSVVILGLGLRISCTAVVYDDGFDIIDESFTSFIFKSIDICGKITVRPRREGDTIRLLGQGNTKTLKKLFIERRVPARKRAQIPVIADDNGVLAVYGIGIGDRALPEYGEIALKIDFEELDG